MSELLSPTACTHLSLMFTSVLFFHISEYILAIAFHGKRNVTLGSLLFSKGYIMALAISLLEYLVEIRYFPRMKEYWFVSYTGLAMVVLGEIVRKSAIITAGMAFTHLIRTRHDTRHELVTNGVYGFVRHPGYCGFLVWSVGTQIMMCSPVSTVGFAVVVWRFFHERIPYEEHYLRKFFGARYVEYSQRVCSGVPFVK